MHDNPEGKHQSSAETRQTEGKETKTQDHAEKETRENPEKKAEIAEKAQSHFESTYALKANEKYEVNNYRYETDSRGRIQSCEGSLRLEEGKRNPEHQTKAGGEYRLKTDDGGHLIATRFGGSEKVDNIVPMDSHLNRSDYKKMEGEWADDLKNKNQVDVKVRCNYEGESSRPESFTVKYKVTDQNGYSWHETREFDNTPSGGKNYE